MKGVKRRRVRLYVEGREELIAELDAIESISGADNRSEAMRKAIHLTYKLLTSDSDIVLIDMEGNRTKVLIT